jgi:hypothetical protein
MKRQMIQLMKATITLMEYQLTQAGRELAALKAIDLENLPECLVEPMISWLRAEEDDTLLEKAQ